MRSIVAVLLLLALFTGCSPSDDNTRSKPSRAASGSSGSASASADRTGASLTVDSIWRWESSDGSSGTATVLGYEQPVGRTAVQPEERFGAKFKGYVWAAAEVEFCLSKGSHTTYITDWELAYADGPRIAPSPPWPGTAPSPRYPFFSKMPEGECRRGSIPYIVPGEVRPAALVFTTKGIRQPGKWAVSKG